jgi:predicted permease
MSRAEAHRLAHSTFGGVERVREEARDARGTSGLEHLRRDLRYTLRGLLREPMLLLAATVSIALGVGSNLAVFSLARQFVFATPDVRRPAELVQFQVSHGSHATYQRWIDLHAGGALAGIAGFTVEHEVNWHQRDATVAVVPMVVTANFFDVTGVPMALGRGFSAAEARADDDPHLAVLSHEFWQRRLAGDSAIIGQSLTLNGEAYVVTGVLAPRARSVAGLNLKPGVYASLNRRIVPELLDPEARVVQLIGRLKPDQTLEQGRALVDALDRRLGRLQGDSVLAGVQEFSQAGSLASGKARRVVGGFFVLLGVVSFLVLLIACANVAGLLIARATRKRQEVAIRLAIGGTRARLVQQFLAEGFWLALIGTVGGLALSLVFMRAVNRFTLPVAMPIALQLTPDRALFVVALGLVFLSIVLCTLVPAFNATRLSLVPALKREEPFVATRRFTARGVLLAGQVTVSTVLLLTAFLFVRNLGRTQVTNPGFEVDRTLVAQLGFVRGRPAGEHLTLLQRAVDGVRAMPEVEEAAFTASVPLTIHGGSSNGFTMRVNDRDATEHVQFQRLLVGPRYFATMGVALRSGREFRATDNRGTPAVAIINEEFARRHFGGANPVGSRLRFEQQPLDVEIVGVAANGKHQTLGEMQRAAMYLPLLQHPDQPGVAFVVARTLTDPLASVHPVRQALGRLDASMSVQVEPMRTALQFALLPSRIGAVVLGSLGVLGLVLAAFGLYAMVAYNVSRRVGEIAIRSALGATRGGIVRLVLGDTAILVGGGLALGLAISSFVTAPLATFLVTGLSATDPVSFVATGLVFILVAALASWLPARQAMRVSPVVAMRLD